MKIDLEHFEVYVDLGKTQKVIVDQRKEFANALYQRGQGIACHALALKLWNTEGVSELTDEEYALLVRFAESVYPPCIIEALKEYEHKEDGNDKGNM